MSASSTVNGKLWPLDRPGQSTQAAALLQGRNAGAGPQDRRADQWIKNFRADQYWVKEDSPTVDQPECSFVDLVGG